MIMLTECLVVVTLHLALQCMVAPVVAISNLLLFVATVVSALLAETCIPSTELPPSDLRNKFTEIENTVKNGAPVYLTKNGYGSMVVMSIEAYSKLTESIEDALDVADKMAEETNERYSHEEMFAKLREAVHE